MAFCSIPTKSVSAASVRHATVGDTEEISSILREANRWLERRGIPLWQDDELGADRLAAEVGDGLYFFGAGQQGLVATMRFQLADTLVLMATLFHLRAGDCGDEVADREGGL